MKQSRTVIIPQSRSKSKGTNRRFLHNEYVFYSDIQLDTPLRIIDCFIEALEHVIGSEIWDISIVFDYTAQAPDGSEGATTIKLSTATVLEDEYEVIFSTQLY